MKTPTQLAKQFFQEVWKPPHNLEAINELMTEDYEIVTGGKTIKGREEFKTWVAQFQKKLLNAENEHLDLFESEEGNKVVSRWICRGTNNGILNTKPDQKEVSFTGIAIWEVHNGKLSKCWVERASWELAKELKNI